MKICVPTENGSGTTSRISDHFGGSPFFVVIDTDTDGVDVISGSGCGGQGRSDHHLGQLAARGVEAVVCRGMGRRAFAAMREAGVDVLRTEHDTVSEVLEAARGGRLSPLTEEDACGGGRHGRGHHQHGHHDSPARRHRHGHGRNLE